MVEDDGSWNLGPLPKGKITLETDAPWQMSEGKSLSIGDAPLENVALKLKRLPQHRAIGHVQTPDGQPVAGARLLVTTHGNWQTMTLLSDAGGHFDLPDLASDDKPRVIGAARPGFSVLVGSSADSTMSIIRSAPCSRPHR